MTTYNVLIMGASYGSLLATKLLFGGHKINDGMPPGRSGGVQQRRAPGCGCRSEAGRSRSSSTRGNCRASSPPPAPARSIRATTIWSPLAMQEPQYRSPGVRELLDAVARSRMPCMSIMNMPPLPYLKRIPGLNDRPAQTRLYRCERVGQFRARAPDLVQPGPAGHPPARREDQRAASHVADQFQGGPVRLREIHRDVARDAGRHRGGTLRSGRRHRSSCRSS